MDKEKLLHCEVVNPNIRRDYFGFCDKHLDKQAFLICKNLLKKYGRYELGRNRIVFFGKNHVLKFPTCSTGMLDNDWEGSVCVADEKGSENDIWPITRWLEIGEFICCMMQKVEPVMFVDYSTMPDWVGSIDGGQVGWTRKGKLVAYDFGLG